MSKKTIYLIRHGETDYNLRGVVQGSGIDAHLNETGRKQADSFFEMYGDLPFDTVYTSALIRTHQSVKRFLDAGRPHIVLPGLNEISWGHKEGKVPNSEDDHFYNQLMAIWRNGETHVPVEGGESPEDVAFRQKEALEFILSREDESLILVAMHGRAMRILLTQLTNLPLSEMDTFEHRNLCLYKIEYCYRDKRFEILESNNTRHLLEIPVI